MATKPSLDQDGQSEQRQFGNTADRGGDGARQIADRRAEQTSQDAKANSLAQRTVAAGGQVPKPIGG